MTAFRGEWTFMTESTFFLSWTGVAILFIESAGMNLPVVSACAKETWVTGSTKIAMINNLYKNSLLNDYIHLIK